MIRNGILFILLLLFSSELQAQSDIGLVAYYSFDACDAIDDTGKGADGVISGTPGCVCGVFGNALAFDGQDDFIQFLGSFNVLFSSNFTISFYIRPESPLQVQNIMTKKEQCDFDSTFTIRYNGSTNGISVEMSEDISTLTRNEAILNTSKCWHHIAFVRISGQHLLYFDGEIQSIEGAGSLLNVNNNGIFSIADSPCLLNGEARYRGELDELRLYNRALSSAEILELYMPIDELTTRDTIIFRGNSIQTRIPASCASSFLWSPFNGVDVPNSREPVLTPFQTTTYSVDMDYGNCVATDTVRVIVVDSTELQCDQIFLPKAFTPNGDGLNELYGISNPVFLGDLLSFEIYDRWGSRIFSTSDPGEKWDGTFRGEEMMPGMYVYKLRFICEGQEDVQIESFTLIR